MTTKPKRKAPADAIDPVFAAISEHKARTKEWHRLNTKLDNAKCKREIHGLRPWPLIAWRNYGEIGSYEIDKAREEFLEQPGDR